MQDLEATAAENEKTCWCLFRLGITNSKEGCKPFTRESFGRFSTDLKQTDSASLGWNDFMSMDTFTDAAQGYLKVKACQRSCAFGHIAVSCQFVVASNVSNLCDSCPSLCWDCPGSL